MYCIIATQHNATCGKLSDKRLARLHSNLTTCQCSRCRILCTYYIMYPRRRYRRLADHTPRLCSRGDYFTSIFQSSVFSFAEKAPRASHSAEIATPPALHACGNTILVCARFCHRNRICRTISPLVFLSLAGDGTKANIYASRMMPPTEESAPPIVATASMPSTPKSPSNATNKLLAIASPVGAMQQQSFFRGADLECRSYVPRAALAFHYHIVVHGMMRSCFGSL